MGGESLPEHSGYYAQVRARDGQEPASSALVIRNVLVHCDGPGFPVPVAFQGKGEELVSHTLPLLDQASARAPVHTASTNFLQGS